MNAIDPVCREAARVIGVSTVWVGVLEGDEERVLASYGSRASRLPAGSTFANAVADSTGVVVVHDTSSDARFSGHPMTTGTAGLRFYAGVPLVASDGAFLGALSAVDRQTRDVSAETIGFLRMLGGFAARELETGQKLREADERFRDFFDQSSDHIVTLGPRGTVLHANSMAMDSLGLRRGEPLATAVEAERRQEFEQTLARVFESGNADRVETVFLSVDGMPITLEGWLHPKSIDGKAAMVRVVFRDVTDRKQFETELGNARDAALETARLKNQFLTNVSHEIRTPMNGIVGMVDLLLTTRMDAEQRDYAHQARASAEQLLSIVNNILYISNLEAGGLAPSRVDLDLRRMLQRIVDVEKVAALGKELEIHSRIDDRVPSVLRGNQSKVRQVVTNLLENAVKFTDRGTITLAVNLLTETPTHHVVRFEIRDTGRGIPEEDRLVLFERFAQLDGASTRPFSGIGLGLATARHLVETMGGLIDVDSVPGEGSTFWFSIPFAKAAPGPHPIVTSEFDLKGTRVLLLDQLPTSRKVVRHYLESTWGMRVEVAEDAASALAALHGGAKSDPYRLVIFDAVPGETDPFWFAKTVRLDAAIAGVRLLHLVSTRTGVNEEKMREVGINAWIRKPVGQRELLDALVIAMAHDAAGAESRATVEANAVDEGGQPPADLTSLEILLAEDNFLNMKLTMTQLQKLGCTADTAANGREVLEAVARKRYDVILMDCQMPIVDGYDATIEIRRMEAGGQRQRHWIIAMTANALEGDREKCLAAGMDDYLSKPTHHEQVAQALARPARLRAAGQ